MDRLLKIVEGPMKGAEIALVAGTRVKVGSGEDCDIVVADASLAPVAFELDVSEDAVTLIAPDGETRELKDFEIAEFGSTSVAVGPAEGAWGELYRPEPTKDVAPAEPPTDDRDAEEPKADEETKDAEESKDASGSVGPEAAAAKKKKGGRRLGCLVVLLILAVLVSLLLVLANRYHDRLPAFADRLPAFADRLPALVDRVKATVFRRASAAEPEPAKPAPTIGEIAAAHGLRTEVRDEQTYLVGNLKRRTERLAIRALALAADRTVKFDLTDDQSLKTAVADTLSLVAGNRMNVVSVTNRVAEIAGSVSGPGELASVLKMLNQEVPQLVTCVTTGVRAAIAAEEPSVQTVARNGAPAVVTKNPVRTVPSAAPIAPNLPVAGILTAPYPCVVLTDGSRCLEGARIGGLVLKRISAEELVFKAGEAELKWRP